MPSTFASLDISNQDDITPAIFTLLLQWMYAGHVPMTLSTVQMMMKAAETYGIKGTQLNLILPPPNFIAVKPLNFIINKDSPPHVTTSCQNCV